MGMRAIVEIPRPYPETILEPLFGETVLTVAGHAFWCASSRIARIVCDVLQQQDTAERMEDVVWVCRILNAREIGEALKMPHRRDRMERHHYETEIAELRRQQEAIAANPELAAVMDDPNELVRRIGVFERRLATLRPNDRP